MVVGLLNYLTNLQFFYFLPVPEVPELQTPAHAPDPQGCALQAELVHAAVPLHDTRYTDGDSKLLLKKPPIFPSSFHYKIFI